MADTEETPETETVYWRLPSRVASDNRGDWSALREHLAAWEASGDKLEVEAPDETRTCSMGMPSKIVRALEKEAVRLTKTSKKRWTAGRVAREVWDAWEAP